MRDNYLSLLFIPQLLSVRPIDVAIRTDLVIKRSSCKLRLIRNITYMCQDAVRYIVYRYCDKNWPVCTNRQHPFSCLGLCRIIIKTNFFQNILARSMARQFFLCDWFCQLVRYHLTFAVTVQFHLFGFFQLLDVVQLNTYLSPFCKMSRWSAFCPFDCAFIILIDDRRVLVNIQFHRHFSQPHHSRTSFGRCSECRLRKA